MISSGSMTNRIDRLEKIGFVRRTANPADKRGTLVTLTLKGLEVIDRAVTAHVENQKAIVAALHPDEQAQLSALLAKLINNLNAPHEVSTDARLRRR
jgi:DNA-binding MarR family transcriptional regulator